MSPLEQRRRSGRHRAPARAPRSSVAEISAATSASADISSARRCVSAIEAGVLDRDADVGGERRAAGARPRRRTACSRSMLWTLTDADRLVADDDRHAQVGRAASPDARRLPELVASPAALVDQQRLARLHDVLARSDPRRSGSRVLRTVTPSLDVVRELDQVRLAVEQRDVRRCRRRTARRSGRRRARSAPRGRAALRGAWPIVVMIASCRTLVVSRSRRVSSNRRAFSSATLRLAASVVSSADVRVAERVLPVEVLERDDARRLAADERAGPRASDFGASPWMHRRAGPIAALASAVVVDEQRLAGVDDVLAESDDGAIGSSGKRTPRSMVYGKWMSPSVVVEDPDVDAPGRRRSRAACRPPGRTSPACRAARRGPAGRC